MPFVHLQYSRRRCLLHQSDLCAPIPISTNWSAHNDRRVVVYVLFQSGTRYFHLRSRHTQTQLDQQKLTTIVHVYVSQKI
ncbi:hypothetical protein HBH70_065040 [Parastagonospora nodorum]|nr:hypothetical protein HBH49_062090 [Parastagonospora nodorum]KAH4072097.1 hypothetical protein HBH50_072520 [Parastagonospora nodorum]KAH4094981.1 hypothetical protein HBH48_060780 [Parastagonospora nodorum]KAH4102144.1 hypothetical protein HBH46_129100 [Parastagonospora nodorum]KAH4130088.1 hypothetical protein HBH47_022810 [Parastagonospora nodorum]